MLKKTADLQNRRAPLAQSILANPYNFRDQAKVLRRNISDVDCQIATAEATGTDVVTLQEKHRKLWDELFTRRYVVRDGYAPMEQYQEVVRHLDALKR